MRRASTLTRAVLSGALGLALAAAAAAAIADPPKGGYTPDPPGIPSRTQWVFEVLHSRGITSMPRARRVTVPHNTATARVLGRFAVELYVGKELLDRIRFNIPLTGDAPQKDKSRPFRHPTFDQGVTTRLKVQMADSPRATWGRLIDRMTGDEQRFWWPPDPTTGRLVPLTEPYGGVAATDAGALDASDASDASDAGDAGDATPFPADATTVPATAMDGGFSDAGPSDGGFSDGSAPRDAGAHDGGPAPGQDAGNRSRR
ncbi:hypothetical protein [Chondromyces apiculatus]|uniref:Seroreactive antigen BMN1-7 n=1 Tax=Chondromyces apiculatus DSM 436 TaxID=1192034 RepID=A0A017SUU5_9BACT|nr:hypothetical protein [Chondromyces apiculatus]EYF00385.1 Seroreactive antigen BMN1-7 [Chondromyces apiculatus DSM 436]